jgi:hypothetical protein
MSAPATSPTPFDAEVAAVAAEVCEQDPRLAEAIVRVGMQPEQRLRWLLDFVDRDLSDRSAVASSLREVLIFVIGAGFAAGPSPRQEVRGLFAEILRSPRFPARTVQRRVRDALRELATARRMRLPYRVTEERVLPDGTMIHLAGGGARERFYAAVAALVSVLGDRLAVCGNAGCRRLFVKAGRMAYCSPQCSQVVRTARFRSGATRARAQHR